MTTGKSSLFREKSLQRLNSPERLDQLIQVTYPTDWLILLTLGLLIAAALGWGILGSIPVTVFGRGVFILPRTITQFQASASGRLVKLQVREGAVVRRGELLALIDQPELRSRLDQLLQRLAAIETLQRTNEELTASGRQLSLRAVRTQRTDLQRTLDNHAAVLPLLKQQFENARQLRAQGLLAESPFIQAQQAYLDKLGVMNSLRTQLTELDAREQELDRQSFSARSPWIDQRNQLLQEIRQTRQLMADTGRVLSPESGRVLTVSINQGAYVEAGRVLGSIQKSGSSARPVVLAFFVDGDGKRIKAQMNAQLSPDTVEQQRFGSIVGTVAAAADFPITPAEVAAVVGKEELARLLTENNRHLQILIHPTADVLTFSGFRWTTSQGPPLKITNGTTGNVLVTVEQRAPITYVVPLLRHWTGIRS